MHKCIYEPAQKGENVKYVKKKEEKKKEKERKKRERESKSSNHSPLHMHRHPIKKKYFHYEPIFVV